MRASDIEHDGSRTRSVVEHSNWTSVCVFRFFDASLLIQAASDGDNEVNGRVDG